MACGACKKAREASAKARQRAKDNMKNNNGASGRLKEYSNAVDKLRKKIS